MRALWCVMVIASDLTVRIAMVLVAIWFIFISGIPKTVFVYLEARL